MHQDNRSEGVQPVSTRGGNGLPTKRGNLVARGTRADQDQSRGDSDCPRKQNQDHRAIYRAKAGERAPCFENHWDQERAIEALRNGRLQRGVLRVNQKKNREAYLPALKPGDDDILIEGPSRRNRAVHGDVVYVEIMPESEWKPIQQRFTLSSESTGRDRATTLAPKSTGEKADPSEEENEWEDAEDLSQTPAGTETKDSRETHRTSRSSEKFWVEERASPGKEGVRLRPCGKVVYIEHHSVAMRDILCTLTSQLKPDPSKAGLGLENSSIRASTKRLRAIPFNNRLPWILINLDSCSHDESARALLQPGTTLNQDSIWPVKITGWAQNDALPEGVVTGPPIGEAGTVETEVQLCMAENDLTQHMEDMGDDVATEVESILLKTSQTHEAEVAKRKDFRECRVMTIDPLTARDLDDAIHIKQLPNTSPPVYEIGVHIADVGHFVKPGGAIDEEAAARCTTVYLTHRAYHMLPRALCSDLCSLNPGSEKLVMSALFWVREDGTLDSSRPPEFYKAVIHSCCRWAYEEAQFVLDGRTAELSPPPSVHPNAKNPNVTFEECCHDVRLLADLTAKIRRLRYNQGSLALYRAKVRFQLDTHSLLPKRLRVEEHMQSHELVEELMLIANKVVAQRMVSSPYKESAVLRRHPAPAPKALADLAKYLDQLGIPCDFSSSAAVHETLKRFQLAAGTAASEAVEQLILKHIALAEYFTYSDEEPTTHFALSFPIYTHFTSPIRRYADVMVHRVLAAIISRGSELEQRDATSPNAPLDPLLHGDPFDPGELSNQCCLCNDLRWKAKMASESCDRSFFCMWLRTREDPYVSLGTVLEIQDQSVIVYIRELGTEGRVYYKGADETMIFPKFSSWVKTPTSFTVESLWKVSLDWTLESENITAQERGEDEETEGQAEEDEKAKALTHDMYKGGMSRCHRQVMRVMCRVPVYVLPTSGVPIDFRVVLVPPSDPNYRKVLPARVEDQEVQGNARTDVRRRKVKKREGKISKSFIYNKMNESEAMQGEPSKSCGETPPGADMDDDGDGGDDTEEEEEEFLEESLGGLEKGDLATAGTETVEADLQRLRLDMDASRRMILHTIKARSTQTSGAPCHTAITARLGRAEDGEKGAARGHRSPAKMPTVSVDELEVDRPSDDWD